MYTVTYDSTNDSMLALTPDSFKTYADVMDFVLDIRNSINIWGSVEVTVVLNGVNIESYRVDTGGIKVIPVPQSIV